MSAIDMLLDENNSDPIVLFNEKNEEIRFEQIAVVPIEGVIHAILKPVGQFQDLADDEALVFTVKEQDGEDVLVIEEDDGIVDAVFAEYYRLLAEAGVI